MMREIEVGALDELSGGRVICFSSDPGVGGIVGDGSWAPVGGSESTLVHATEKGCDIHNDTLGR